MNVNFMSNINTINFARVSSMSAPSEKKFDVVYFDKHGDIVDEKNSHSNIKTTTSPEDVSFTATPINNSGISAPPQPDINVNLEDQRVIGMDFLIDDTPLEKYTLPIVGSRARPGSLIVLQTVAGEDGPVQRWALVGDQLLHASYLLNPNYVLKGQWHPAIANSHKFKKRVMAGTMGWKDLASGAYLVQNARKNWTRIGEQLGHDNNPPFVAVPSTEAWNDYCDYIASVVLMLAFGEFPNEANRPTIAGKKVDQWNIPSLTDYEEDFDAELEAFAMSPVDETHLLPKEEASEEDIGVYHINPIRAPTFVPKSTSTVSKVLPGIPETYEIEEPTFD